MTTNIEELKNARNTKEKGISVDGQAVAKLFSKVKENENLNKKIKIKVDRTPKKIINNNIIDFEDQMLYYRKLRGYTKKQVSKAIGVSEDTYSRYEKKEIKLTNIKRINRIVKFLKFEEEPKLSDYVKFLMSSPERKLEKYLKENKISKTTFSELSGISRRAMNDWFANKKTISEDSYNKIKKFLIKFEESKNNEEQIEDEEEME